MKRLTIAALTLVPGSAFAHGAHPPVPEEAHNLAHVGLGIALGALAVVALWALLRRVRK